MSDRLVVTAQGQRVWQRLRRRGSGPRAPRPTRVVALLYLTAIILTTGLLSLPIATLDRERAPFPVTLFMATSAASVTGLASVDIQTYFSPFGEVVLLVALQVGGLGIMTVASLLGVFVARRLGLQTRLLTQLETRTIDLGDVRRILRGVARFSIGFESIIAVILTLRFWLGYGESFGQAAWFAVRNAVGAFNNAGFNWRSDGLLPYVSDPWVCLPIAVGIIAGGLGFPVLIELRREIRPRAWSLHTKLTLTMTGALLVLGPAAVTAFEWTNPRTLGSLDIPAKLLAGFFQGVVPRTAGFVTLDYAAMEETTWLATDAMMFIGGGSASTAGGIKVTTFVVLLLVIIAEVRGHAEAEVFGRAIAPAVVRQAMTVALLGVAVVAAGTALLLAITGLDLDRVLFEAISAFSTTGLSTGITTQLSGSAQVVLVVLMFLGRVGTVTLASALALRSRQRLYRLPEGRPIVG